MLLTVDLAAAAILLVWPVGVGSRQQAGSDGAASIVVGDHRTVTMINRGGPPGEKLLSDIAANIGGSVDAVEAFWGVDWPHQIVVEATGSARQFAERAGGGDAGRWTGIAAVAVADRVDFQRRLADGQRIVFAPGAAEMSPPALRIVLGHELFHYAARADTAFDAPRWLVEGVADFVARGTPTPADRPVSPVSPPSDADLDAPGREGSQAYDRAWWFAGFIADRYGTAKLRELYLAACGPGHADPSTAVRQVLGVDMAEVLTHWQQWLTS